MTRLRHVPHGLSAINETYGDCDANSDGILDQEWFDENIGVFSLPYPLRKSWDPNALIARFQCHILVAEALIDALEEIGLYRGGSYLERCGYNRLGGCFNFRFAKGNPDARSTHSWGIAVDINPDLGPFGVENHRQPAFIIEAFKKRGFFAGADWPMPYTDAMHFQACTGW